MYKNFKKVILPGMAWSICCLISGCTNESPNDSSLIANFERNEKYFEEVRAYLCSRPEKRVVMMSPEWSEPKASGPEKDYLYTLFRKIGANGVYYDGDCSFRLQVWSAGIGGGGDYKGYSYRPNEHWRGELVSTPLDNIDVENSKTSFLSRRIQRDWYLSLQHWK